MTKVSIDPKIDKNLSNRQGQFWFLAQHAHIYSRIKSYKYITSLLINLTFGLRIEGSILLFLIFMWFNVTKKLQISLKRAEIDLIVSCIKCTLAE